MSALGKWLRVLVECALCAGSAVTGVVLFWQITALVVYVTIGPRVGPMLFPVNDQLKVLVLALASMPGLVVAAVHLRRHGKHVAAALVLQLGSGLSVTAVSYRFVPLLLFIGVFAVGILSGRSRRQAWAVWALALLLCVAPVDLSTRLSSSGSRLVPAESCESLVASRKNARNEVVCTDAGSRLYSEPRWVWVW